MEDLDALLAELERTTLSLDNINCSLSAPGAGDGEYDVLPLSRRGEDSGSSLQTDAGGEACSAVNRSVPTGAVEDAKAQVQPVYVTHLEDKKDHVYSEVPDELPPMTPTEMSTAVRKLDELMLSLQCVQSKLEEGAPNVSEPANLSPTTTLENMLVTLEKDLKNLGAAVVPKGSCAYCAKPIAGKVITALGTTWHPEHFTCAHCHQEIGAKPFFEKAGLPYCQADYEDLFLPRCAYCKAPIVNKVLTALDQTWHPDHFFCSHCGEVFEGNGYHEKDGKPYCRKDFLALFAPKCGSCSRPVLENYFTAINTIWHPECFVCGDCFCSLSSGCFFEVNGRPFCELDYHRRQGTICKGCQMPIAGRCVTAMGSRFHPEHFVCSFCMKQLSQGIFKEHNDKAYCHSCFCKLFV